MTTGIIISALIITAVFFFRPTLRLTVKKKNDLSLEQIEEALELVIKEDEREKMEGVVVHSYEMKPEWNRLIKETTDEYSHLDLTKKGQKKQLLLNIITGRRLFWEKVKEDTGDDRKMRINADKYIIEVYEEKESIN